MPNPTRTPKRSPTRPGPMQLTASSGYAIHGLAYLALKEPGSVIFLSEISAFFAIPSSYLAKVFQALARARLVVSYRGAKGGYALSRVPGEITLREVIEVFEGPLRNQCSLTRGPCNLEIHCTVYRHLAKAQQAFLDALEEQTVLDIALEFRRFEEQGINPKEKLNQPE